MIKEQVEKISESLWNNYEISVLQFENYKTHPYCIFRTNIIVTFILRRLQAG